MHQFLSTLRRELNNNRPENIRVPEKRSTVWSENVLQDFLRAELSWSHYKLLIRIESETARNWYMKEAAEQGWSVRALQRQIDSLYYERLLSSKNKKAVSDEAADKTDNLKTRPEDILKDPYILEFLNLSDKSSFRESEFEQSLIDKLQEFLLELGKGFAFVARQQRISTETREFYIDLVFYNYYLKYFVIIDLKTGELTHQDVGQMDMYVRMFDDLKRQEDDMPTVGIILCTEKDETIVKYSVLKENMQLFASKYMLYLICNVGAPGQLFRVPDLRKPMTIGPNSILVRPKNQFLLTELVFYYFKSHFGKNAISSIISATAQFKFNKTGFRSLLLPLPPLNEQKRIAAKLDHIMPKIDSVKERLERIPRLAKRFRKSVLTAAVTGKLTENWREEHSDLESALDLIESIREKRIKNANTKSQIDKIKIIYNSIEENDS